MQNEQGNPFMVSTERQAAQEEGRENMDQTPMQSTVFLIFCAVFMELG